MDNIQEAFRALEQAMINMTAAPGGMNCDELEAAVVTTIEKELDAAWHATLTTLFGPTIAQWAKEAIEESRSV